MQAQRRYSDYFATLHDEAGPIGSLGAGPHRFGSSVHYSVLRGVTWTDHGVVPLATAHAHDFAVIWDEDHDERVIDVLERMLEANLLSPVVFIGERKGMLTVILDQRFFLGHPREEITAYLGKVRAIADSVNGDSWSLEAGSFDSEGPLDPEGKPEIIDTGSLQQEIYLRNIDNLWQLGAKPLVRRPAPRILY